MAEGLLAKQHVVDESILQYLKDHLMQEWRDVGRYLGVSDADINHIESDSKGNQKEINYQMLLKWKQQNAQISTYNALAEALIKAKRPDLADYINKEVEKRISSLEQSKRSQQSPSEQISKKMRSTVDEMEPFETKVQGSFLKDMLASFIESLKKTYERLARTVRPVPYFTDWHCVGDIFVEGNLEEMEEKKTESERERWRPVTSYHDIALKSDTKRLLLDGDPGFGKSTLALLMAYEWCSTDNKSPLSQIDIFIVIRLREVRNVRSIFRVIKLLLLPSECTLQEENIQEVLTIHNIRLVFILDGFDEFPQTDEDSDIYSIIKGEMFPDAKVVVMTRPDCIPSLLGPDTKRMRLTGFDETMQDRYIRKAVFSSDTEANNAENLIKVFKENDLLADICQVPLFFVMFAHLVKDKPDLERQPSITAYYSYMIKCFFSHMMNKKKAPFGKRRSIKEDSCLRLKLGKIGFDGLAHESQKLMWNKDNLVADLGNDGYEKYKSVGILLEEEIFNDRSFKGKHLYDEIEYEITGKFFHKTVQELYAAYQLVQLLMEDDNKGKKYLLQFKPSTVRYLFLFACGLNDMVAHFVISYLNGLEDQQGVETAILCLLELGDLKNYSAALKKLSSTGVSIRPNQSKLLQRAKVNLIQNSSRYRIETKFVELFNCFGSVDVSSGNFATKHGLILPTLCSVKNLKIEDEGREWRMDELHEMLKYASKCDGLKSICFSRCLIPFDFPRGPFVSDLVAKGVTVQWNSPHTECPAYHMNFGSFTWERQAFPFYLPELHGQLLLQQEYNNLKMVFRGEYRDTDWQKTHIPLEDTPTALVHTPTGSFRIPVVMMQIYR